MDDRITTYKLSLWMLLILALTAAVYFPGLKGDFVFDSRTNISANEALQLTNLDWEQIRTAALSNHSGPLGRPIPVTSFALNHIFSGKNPFGYKLTNVLIHVVNGILLLLLTLKLLAALPKTESPDRSNTHIWIALCVTAVWLLHPINLTNVLYVVQRMNSLSALFVLIGMLSYTAGRSKALEGKSSFLATFIVPTICTVLAVLSKENGALLPAFLFVIEITVFNFRTCTALNKKLLAGFYFLTLLAPGIIALLFLIIQPDWLTSQYEIRNFSLVERLLTEARVLWFYISLILIPNGPGYGLFHDDIVISKGLLDPLSTLPAVIALLSATAFALYIRKRARVLALGILFFLTGHLLESSIFPLEIAYEHRNYIPSYGILLALFYYLLHPQLSARWLFAKRSAAVVLIGIFTLTTLMRSLYWENTVELSIAEQAHHPDSPRANIMLGITYGIIAEARPAERDRYYELSKNLFLKEADLAPNTTSGLFQLILFSSIVEKPVNPQWVSRLADRLEHQVFHANNMNLINAMISCQFDKRCSLPDKTVNELIQAALRNPSARGTRASELYTMASKYALLHMNDVEYALYLVSSAAESSPETPRYRIHLVKLLVALNRFSEATEEINKAEKLDTMGRESISIKELRKIISSQEKHDSLALQ